METSVFSTAKLEDNDFEGLVLVERDEDKYFEVGKFSFVWWQIDNRVGLIYMFLHVSHLPRDDS